MSDRTNNMFNFVLSERFITLTVIGSIFTFTFISSMKGDLLDPLLHFILPEEFFGFMNIVIRDGETMNMPPRKLELKFGNFFRELTTWLIAISSLYFLAKYTRFPDTPGGNYAGAAVM